MKYARITEDDYNVLEKIYSDLSELSSENIRDYILWDIQNKFCNVLIDLGREFEKLQYEINMGNTIIDNNILTCISEDGKQKRYNLVSRKANIGDVVYIILATNQTPFNNRHIHRFYKVTELADAEILDMVIDHVVVDNWCLYHDQYLVLEELS